VNHFALLQCASQRNCRKAKGLSLSASGHFPVRIDTPLPDAYIFSWALRMSSTPFGDHLKREREMRGVTLEEISAATRIATRFLVALENEDWPGLPGGIFNRGFIRSVARFLGLDEDSLIAEYEMETKDKGEARPAAHPSPGMQRNWRPAAAAVTVLVLAIAGVSLAYHHYRLQIWRHLHNIRQGSPAAVVVTTPPSPPAPDSQQPSVPPASSDATDALTLRIQAALAADVKVIADGTTVFDGHLDADDVKSFDAHDNFEITSSDSTAVLLQLNGQPVPPMGAPGQPGNVTLTRRDLNTDPGGGH
jgi:cytoskeleton protein RodZ